jgi:hypothetical protein
LYALAGQSERCHKGRSVTPSFLGKKPLACPADLARICGSQS